MNSDRIPYVHRHRHEPKNVPPVRLWTPAELAAWRFRCDCGGALLRSAYVEDCAACIMCGRAFHLVRRGR